MKRKIYSYCYLLVFTVLFSFSGTPALCADKGYFGVRTLGVVSDIIINIPSMLNTRLVYNGPSYDGKGTEIYLYNNYDIYMYVTSQPTHNIGDITHRNSQREGIHGTKDFNTLAPYVGLSWDNTLGNNKEWLLGCNLGVLYHGNKEIELKADGPIFRQSLARERQNLEEELDDYRYYHVIMLWITYKF
jgi:hypothetical protein